jgi:hypothetical protein
MKKLYTIDCPACRVLEAKLQAANIEYETITDEKIFDELQIDTFPMLEIEDGILLSFSGAITYIKEGKI